MILVTRQMILGTVVIICFSKMCVARAMGAVQRITAVFGSEWQCSMCLYNQGVPV